MELPYLTLLSCNFWATLYNLHSGRFNINSAAYSHFSHLWSFLVFKLVKNLTAKGLHSPVHRQSCFSLDFSIMKNTFFWWQFNWWYLLVCLYFMLLYAVGEYFILITIIIIQNGLVCLGIYIMYSLGNKLWSGWSLPLESTWANGEKCCILEINTKQVDGAAGSHIEEKWAASVSHCIFINSTCLCKWQEDINKRM